MTTPITATATVAADDLMRVITNVALSADTDDTRPALTTIHFRAGHKPGMLMAESSNRYVAAQEHFPLADLAAYDSDWDRGTLVHHIQDAHGITPPVGYDSRTEDTIRAEHGKLHADGADHEHTTRPVPVTELDVSVNVKDLGKLVKTIKLVIEPDRSHLLPSERPHVVIEHDTGKDRVSFTLIQNGGTETTVSPRAVTGEFPPLDTLMNAAAERVADTGADLARSYAFNPDYLSIFTKIDTGLSNGSRKVKEVVVFSFTASGKPAAVAIGENYRALIMPVTIPA